MPQAGARICKTLGADFLPYLQLVMPPLLAAAKVRPQPPSLVVAAPCTPQPPSPL